MLEQLRAQVPALDPGFGILQDDNSSAYFGKLLLLQAVTELAALKSSSHAELSLEASSLLHQGAETAEGQLSVDVSLAPVAPVRSGFRFTVGAILGSTHSGGTKYLEFRTIK